MTSGRAVSALFSSAERFLRTFHLARPRAGRVEDRLARMRAEVAATGTYRHTPAELAFGARTALRDSGWCPTGIPWRGLLVRDLRTVRDGPEVASACAEHLRMATTGGRMTPVVSVFAPDTPWRPGPRIRNEQLVGYAGYREAGMGARGDRRNTEFTLQACRLGWRPPPGRGAFDLLPLVIDGAHGDVTVYRLPGEAVLEVPLTHPDLPWFAWLELRWHAVPVISNRCLTIGGIDYPAAPFNGVHLCRVIGRDVLADPGGYAMATTIAERLGLDTTRERTLWRERAILELNRAVLHSFDTAGVRIEHSGCGFLPAASACDRPAFR